MALLHDRQKQLYQQQLNHHGIMAMAACIIIKLGRQQGGLQGSGELMKNQVEAVRDRTVVPPLMSSSTEAGMNPSAMSVFQMQQRQYYAMLMAQQQQVAMAAGNPAMMAQQQQQMAHFNKQPGQIKPIAVAGAKEEQEKRKFRQMKETPKFRGQRRRRRKGTGRQGRIQEIVRMDLS
jgi:hypothetical protein